MKKKHERLEKMKKLTKLYQTAKEEIKTLLKTNALKGKNISVCRVRVHGDNDVSLDLFYDVGYDTYKEEYYKGENKISRTLADNYIEE